MDMFKLINRSTGHVRVYSSDGFQVYFANPVHNLVREHV